MNRGGIPLGSRPVADLAGLGRSRQPQLRLTFSRAPFCCMCALADGWSWQAAQAAPNGVWTMSCGLAVAKRRPAHARSSAAADVGAFLDSNTDIRAFAGTVLYGKPADPWQPSQLLSTPGKSMRRKSSRGSRHGWSRSRASLERRDAIAAGVDPVDHFLEVVGDSRQAQRDVRCVAMNALLEFITPHSRSFCLSRVQYRRMPFMRRIRNAAAAGRQTRNVADDAHQLGVAGLATDHAVAAVPFEPLVAARALRRVDDFAAGRVTRHGLDDRDRMA